MDLKVLEKTLECSSVPAINRTAGTSYDYNVYVEGAKIDIIRRICEENGLILCDSKEDEVLSILNENAQYTDDQKRLKDIIYKHGHHATINKKYIHEEFLDNSEQIIEDKIIEDKIIEDRSNVILEDKDHKTNSLTESIIQKIPMCPDYISLYCLEEDLSKLGLTISKTNNDRVLLFASNNNENPKIFEDYFPIGLIRNQHEEISEKVINCIIKFIKGYHKNNDASLLESTIQKIPMCPDYASLYYLEEDLLKLGLKISRTNSNRVLLCVLDENNDPKNSKIFEDYFPIGSTNNQYEEISERVSNSIVKFIKENYRYVDNISQDNKDNQNWTNGVAFYGKAFGVEQDRPSR